MVLAQTAVTGLAVQAFNSARGATLSSEFLLISACAMWPTSDRRLEAIRAAAALPIDWSRVLSIAKRHQLVGLVSDGLAQARIETPNEIMRELRAQAAISVREDLALAREALRLQHAFDEANLPVAFIKGSSLGLLAYGKLGLRSAKDIDLLAPRESLPAAVKLLVSNGYHRVDPPTDVGEASMKLLMQLRKDFGFVSEANGLYVELHWRLLLNPYAMDETRLFDDSRIINLTGSKGLRTLGEEDLFTYLCVHGACHWWCQLKWLADLGALLATTNSRPEQLYRAAEQRGATRPAALALILCQHLLGTQLPPHLTEELIKSPKSRWFERSALNIVMGHLDERQRIARLVSTRGSLFRLLLNKSPAYRRAELRQLLINSTDVLTVPLPERLWFLYPIMRLPLWIWRHARWRVG